MSLEALIEAAVYVGRADGQFSELELNVFIDRIRLVVGEVVSATDLIHFARRARADLRALGRPAFLERLRSKLSSVPPEQVRSLTNAIAAAEGVKPEEQQAIEELLS